MLNINQTYDWKQSPGKDQSTFFLIEAEITLLYMILMQRITLVIIMLRIRNIEAWNQISFKHR